MCILNKEFEATHQQEVAEHKKMIGKLCHEVEMNVAASQAWGLYSSLELAKLVQRDLPTVIHTMDVLEGDGGVGTILQFNPPPGSGFEYWKEKFILIDNEKRVKITELIEGGFLNTGFTMYNVTFQIIEKGEDLCIVKTTIDYDVKGEYASNASFVTVDVFAKIGEVAKNYLSKNKTN